MNVDGISVAAALAIKNGTIVSGYIASGSGRLILVQFNGTEIDAGLVVPQDGVITGAVNVNGVLTLTTKAGTIITIGSTVAVSTIVYTASGSFKKANFPGLTKIEADIWGGGGAGAGYAGANAHGGGGGGGHLDVVLKEAQIAALPATVSVIVGAGGPTTASGASGATGGNSLFDVHGAGGGGGGIYNVNGYSGGGGGGSRPRNGFMGPDPGFVSNGNALALGGGMGQRTSVYNDNPYKGGMGGGFPGGGAIHGGGGGNAGADDTFYYIGNATVWGGGGGGVGSPSSGIPSTFGVSVYGGAGGAGGYVSGPGQPGVAPGGGGGGAGNTGVNSAGGAGARGEVRLRLYYEKVTVVTSAVAGA